MAQLVVRCELDCVYADQENNNPRVFTEIKSRRGYPNNAHHTEFFRATWYQMLFGRTRRLVVGFETHQQIMNGVHANAVFNTISTYTFDQVRDRAGLTDNDYNALVGLASLIQWIRGNIADGQDKAFTFQAPLLCTLSPL